MNSVEIERNTQHELPVAGVTSEEPVPGSAYKRTPLQQLRPWDHQELAGSASGESGSTAGGRAGQGAAAAGVSPLGTLVLTALVAVIGLSLVRRR